ncbi:MAG: type II toxin-antitoxin system HicB family antitoxin [Candidatus Omnitrophica bacterium]|nr:type II toxin-antitoxin system HicB family antitoxin [Candidatus Omnitrophota bacterium]
MQNYSINISWSDKDEGFIGVIPEFNNLSAFGETYNEVLEELQKVLNGYIEVYDEDNIPLPEPKKLQDYSGQTRLRMPKELHQSLAHESENQGVSLNSYMVYLLSKNYPLQAIEQFGIIVSRMRYESEDLPTFAQIKQVENLSLVDVSDENSTTIPQGSRI